MKRYSFLLIGMMFFSFAFAAYPGPVGLAQAASANLTVAPIGMTTLTGNTGGQPVANLAAQDQSGKADNPSKYVAFTTPGKVYKGYRRYILPANIAVSSITAIKVKINYKGLPKSGQTWSWSLYDWAAKKWIVVGDNSGAKTNIWIAKTFPTTSPKRFVSASREMRVLLQSNNATGNAKLDFESINVTYTIPPTPTTPPSLNLSVDVGAARKPISPYIYGLNFAIPTFADEIDLPVRRWGGNATSRYNWQTGNTNAGSDWYFENMSNGNHSDWIGENLASGADSIITIPMLGYVAKNGSTATCGFKVSIYGNQQDTDSDWQPNCGNGVATNGSPITGNNPLDTSIVVDENDMESWVDSLVTAYGSASNGGVRFYALDNEPELWSETHRDVHHTPQSYDEIYNKGVAYASAIKQADSDAQTLGYVAFGWSGYWYSMRDMVEAAANGYSYFPDYATHGSQYQVEWYLSQMHEYEQNNGIRLLDYLDLHYYPENGVALTTAGNTAKQALRLRSTRSLWDPTYIDESWIGGSDQAADMRSVHLLSRMRNWVSDNYPGTKLAVTEYNFGGLEAINGALAQADVLGIFGREGLDMATLWNYGDTNLGYDHFETIPGAYAFRIYRNYDGSDGRFGDTSVNAASADQSQLAIYAAQRSSDSALTLVVINKTGGALTGNLSLAGFTPSGNAQVYRYSNDNLTAIQHLTDQAVSAGGFSASFPANSITLFAIPGSAP